MSEKTELPIISKRIDNLEFRTTTTGSPEIVFWNENETCFSLLFWLFTDEGYDIRFVGDRAFRYGNEDVTWRLMRYGQNFLDNEFRISMYL